MAEQRKEKITDQTTVTISELAVILGLTSRRIRQLAEEGVLHTAAKNAYPLAESVQAYLRFLSARMPEDDEVKYEHTFNNHLRCSCVCFWIYNPFCYS